MKTCLDRPVMLGLIAALAWCQRGTERLCATRRIAALAVFALAPFSQVDWVDAYLRGERALEAGELAVAEEAFKIALGDLPEHAPSAWGLACVAAREGDTDGSFEWLEVVADLGGIERALLKWDEDLASLRGDPRFGILGRSAETEQKAHEPWSWEAAWSSSWDLGDLDSTNLRVLREDGQVYDVLSGERIPAPGAVPLRIRSSNDGKHPSIPSFTADADQWSVSPDGRRAVALVREGNNSTTILVLDTQSRETIQTHRSLPTLPYSEITFSDDSSRASVVLNQDGSVRFYELEQGQEVYRVEEDSRSVTSARFLSSPEQVAILAKEGGIEVHDVSLGKRLHSFAVPVKRYATLRTAMAGTKIIVSESGREQVFDVTEEGMGRRVFDTAQDSFGWERGGGAISHGKRVAVQHARGLVRVHYLATGEVEGSVASEAVRCRWDLDSSSKDLWGGTSDGFVIRVDGRTGKRTFSERVSEAPIVALDLSDSPPRLACVDAGGGLHILDDLRGSNPQVESVDGLPVLGGTWNAQLKFSPQGHLLFVSVRAGGGVVLNPETREVVLHPDPKEPIRESEWMEDGTEIVLRLGENRLHVLDVEEQAASRTFVVEGVIDEFAIAPGSGDLWVSCVRGGFDVLDKEDGEVLRQIEFNGVAPFWALDEYTTGHLSFDPAGRRVVLTTLGWGYAACWRVVDGKRMWALDLVGGTGAPIYHQFTDDGEGVYIYGQMPDRGRLVRASDGSRVQTYHPLGLMDLLCRGSDELFSPGTDRGLMRVDPKTREVLWTTQVARDGGWLRTSPNGFIDGTPRAVREFHIRLPDAHSSVADVAGYLVDAKRVRASIAGVELAPPDVLAAPRILWQRPEERVVRALPGRTSQWLEVQTVNGDQNLQFEVQVDGRAEIVAGKPDSGGVRLRYLVERSDEGSPRDVRIQALGPRGSRSAPVHYRVEF